MKKLIAFVVAVLVLLMFLMVNYLMWDKENLMKISENDRLEQDWLRGQNRTLQATITEQEKEKAVLENEIKTLNKRVEELSADVKVHADFENDYIKAIELKKNAILSYKRSTMPTLQTITQDWLLNLSSAAYEKAFLSMTTDPRLFGRRMPREEFDAFMQKNITSLIIQMDETGEKVSLFEMIGDEQDDMIIRVRAGVVALLTETKDENFKELSNGANVLVITFQYSPNSDKWSMTQVVSE